MKKYRSHKVVEAAPIVAADFKEDGSGIVVVLHGFDALGEGRKTFQVPPGFKRPNTWPSMCVDGGDYLIWYEDGDLSWSPKAVFEAGYTEVVEADAPKPPPTAGVFRMRPIEVEAFQMTRERRAEGHDWPSWLQDAWMRKIGEEGSLYPSRYPNSDGKDQLMIGTLEGQHLVGWGDYIVGENGKNLHCTEETFAVLYEAA